MIPREASSSLLTLAKGFPIVAVTGPRQSGKTTLVRAVFSDKPYISLEEPDKLELAAGDPRGFLRNFQDGAVIDEAQRFPALFSYLQAIVDEKKKPGLFILTGSQNFGLLESLGQTLAGRVAVVQLLPFSISELDLAGILPHELSDVLFQGLYPPLYDRDLAPAQWLANYVITYLERDVRNLLRVRDLGLFQKFLRMCAARTGQLLNLSALAADCGITHNTAQSWLSVLEASYIIVLLRPHHRNFGKRLVKSPKLYFTDTGLAAWLLNVQSPDHLAVHPLRGGLFESLIVGELLKSRFNRGLASNLFFWRNNLGDEIDVLLDQGTRLVPVEIKSGETVHSDIFKGLLKWRKFTGDSGSPAHVVYGGDEALSSRGVDITPWRETARAIKN